MFTLLWITFVEQWVPRSTPPKVTLLLGTLCLIDAVFIWFPALAFWIKIVE